MSDPLLGDWTISKEVTLKGSALLNLAIKINIAPGTTNGYKLTVPFSSKTMVVDNIHLSVDGQNRFTLSCQDVDDDGKARAVRLVFDPPFNPANIVEAPLGSTVEKWGGFDIFQPSDMGVITGTKG